MVCSKSALFSYLVCCGLLDNVAEFFHGVQKSVYADLEGAAFLTSLLELVTSLTCSMQSM